MRFVPGFVGAGHIFRPEWDYKSVFRSLMDPFINAKILISEESPYSSHHLHKMPGQNDVVSKYEQNVVNYCKHAVHTNKKNKLCVFSKGYAYL